MFKKSTLKLHFLAFLFLYIVPLAHSQPSDTVNTRNAYIFRLIPSAKDNVYGIALGLAGSEIVCKPVSTKNPMA